MNSRKKSSNLLKAMVENSLIKSAGFDAFSAGIRGAVRGLWAGQLDSFDFADNMISILSLGFETAWREGAASCGIAPEERTPQEQQRLRLFTNSQISYLPGLLTYVAANSKANGGKLETASARVPLWANRYGEVTSIAQQMSCGDKKLIWLLGRTKVHCPDCQRLSGRVYRASVWQRMDIYPQSRRLACGGFNCGCTLSVTDLPATRGRPPSVFSKEITEPLSDWIDGLMDIGVLVTYDCGNGYGEVIAVY